MALPVHVFGVDEVVSAEAQLALIQRVLGNPRFRRAVRLRDFLLFVSQRAIRDGSGQLNEQEIGCEVFGRPPGYDTSADNIVRVNATDLRKRIDEYFANEGAHESLVFEIPRGSYKPVFRSRPVALESIAIAPVAAVPEESYANRCQPGRSIKWAEA